MLVTAGKLKRLPLLSTSGYFVATME